jgi:hypothetical protein
MDLGTQNYMLWIQKIKLPTFECKISTTPACLASSLAPVQKKTVFPADWQPPVEHHEKGY